MTFDSFTFILFFSLVFVLYWFVMNRSLLIRNLFLLVISYLFYGWWDWRFLTLIVVSSAVDYWVGKKIESTENKTSRKRLLFLSIAVNIGVLGFFKYFNFFVDSFVSVFSSFGMDIDSAPLDIILPVGISFYTFQTLSYTIDIYRGKMKATNDPLRFFAFVSFFPQLVAGPIERAKDLLPQFDTLRKPDYHLIRSGLLLIGWGLFKKVVIADRLGRYVDASYGAEDLSGGPAIVAVIFFAVQLYIDFSAYSDIAIGCARTFGFNLSLNFNRPYLSKSFSDFWSRWHISLSTWFRDYLYIPLGGSRNEKKWKNVRNVMIVFLISGLWHGASWNFVIWGAINAIFLLTLDRVLSKIGKNGLSRFISAPLIFAAWALSLIFFRAETFDSSLLFFQNLVSGGWAEFYEYGLNETEMNFTIILLIVYFLFEILQEYSKDLIERFYKLFFMFRWCVYLSIIFGIIFLGSYGSSLDDSKFIYFQF